MTAAVRPKRIPHDVAAIQALADLAPELSLRWVIAESNRHVSEQRTLSPALYRALISYMLRAASRHDSDSAFDTLEAAMSLPLETPGALLGFTSQALPAQVANVLCDLVASAARDEPLLPTSPALKLYADAGPGAADQDEYQNACSFHRADFAQQPDVLTEVRTYNLAQMLVYVAMVFEQNDVSASYLSEALGRNHSMWVAPFSESFSKSVQVLDPGLCEALRRLYGAYMSVQREGRKYEIMVKLVDTFMRMSHDQPDSLGLYAEMIADPGMKIRACRAFLTQRFKVDDDVEQKKPFSLQLLHDVYLANPRIEKRYARVYPVVLASLIMAWLEVAPASDLRAPFEAFPIESREAQVVAFIKSMKNYRKKLNATCRMFGKDRVTFNASMHLLTTEIIRECSTLWG